MANLGATFGATGIQPIQPLEVLPPGKYTAHIISSEMRLTKDGTGQYLYLEIDVLEGPYRGRKLFDRLNLVNTNSQTVEIAQRTLSAICHATGRMEVQDSEELHLIPFLAVVTVQPPKNGYGETNKIRYKPLEEAASLPQPAQHAESGKPLSRTAPAPQPNAAAGAIRVPPWKRPG